MLNSASLFSISFNLSLLSIDTILVEKSSAKTYVEKYIYVADHLSTEFVHFKVINGGHQWFGSKKGDLLQWIIGKNNHDINVNDELIAFFLKYKLSDFY